MLQDDHRALQRDFQRFQDARTLWEEEALAGDIVAALRVHLDLDRQLLYPAIREAAVGYALDKCLADHEALELLLDEIEHAGPTEDAFFAKLHLLCEMFHQHVKDEEQPHGVFEQARIARIDLAGLAREMENRKQLLGAPLSSVPG